jgi:hypothetical protein
MRFLTVGIVALLPSLAWGQTTLGWKFKAGDVFFYEVVGKSDEATVVKGQTRKQEVRATWVYRFEVKNAAAEAAALQIGIDEVTVQHAAGATNIESKHFEKAKGAILTATVSPRGEIRTLEGYDNLVDQMADKREGAGKSLRLLYPEAALRQQLQDVLAIVPTGPVTAGTRWQREGAALVMAPLGRFVVAVSGAHLDLDRAGYHKLAATLVGKYERPEAPAESFRVVGGALTLDKGQWACAFDNDRGRVVNQKLSYEVRGELTVDLAGMPTPVEVLIGRVIATRLLPRGKE